MKATPIQMNEKFIADIRNIILSARTATIRSIDFERVKMYWALGERIFCEEQDQNDRAEYGTYMLKNLADKMETEFGSGFSKPPD